MLEADISRSNLTVIVTDTDVALVTYSDKNGDSQVCANMDLSYQCIYVTGRGSGRYILIDGNFVRGHNAVRLVLDNVEIYPPDEAVNDYHCAIALKNWANVGIRYYGENKLTSGRRRSGLEVPHGCSVKLERPRDKQSTLTASSLGSYGGIGGSGHLSGKVSVFITDDKN